MTGFRAFVLQQPVPVTFQVCQVEIGHQCCERALWLQTVRFSSLCWIIEEMTDGLSSDHWHIYRHGYRADRLRKLDGHDHTEPFDADKYGMRRLFFGGQWIAVFPTRSSQAQEMRSVQVLPWKQGGHKLPKIAFYRFAQRGHKWRFAEVDGKSVPVDSQDKDVP